jgi:formate dehydrogenase iron-sulfur subunit
VTACLDTNGLDRKQAARDRLVAKDGLSANRFSTIADVAEGRFARRACMHCVDPSCVSACLVGGLTKTEEGPVVYDNTKCIGCRYCMLACPFHIPRYEWGKTYPLVRKCDMCFDRLQQGQQPACVEACPNEALLFGERDRLLKKAHRRIDSKPALYLPRVWGENELGGTGVLYISDVDLAALGWPKQAQAGIPSLTEPLIEKTPFIGLSVAGGLLAVNWIIQRRMKLADTHSHRPGSTDETEQGIEN